MPSVPVRFGGARLPWTVAVAVAAAVVYATALGNGFARDDVRIVQERELVRQGDVVEALRSPWWPDFQLPGGGLHRPVALAALVAQGELFDGDPTGFHVVTVALHVAVSVSVFLLLAAFLPLAAAGGGGLLFAVHPVHVEAVASVVGQAELLAALAGLACAAAYLWSGRRAPGPARALGWLAVAALYGLAFLSKEGAVVLPGLLILLGTAEVARAAETEEPGSGRGPDVARRLQGRLADEVLLFGLLAAVLATCLVLRLSVLGTVRGEVVAPSLVGLGTVERIYTSLSLWPEYVRLLLFPVDLAADYAPGVLLPARTPDGGVLLGGAVLVGVVIATAISFPRRPVAALGLGWIVLSLLPVSNLLFPTGLLLGERTLYLPSVGLALVVGDATRATGLRSPVLRRAAVAAGLAILVALGVRTAVRNPVWRSTESVIASLEADHPRAHAVVHARAVQAFNAGRIDEADRLFAEALRLVPWHYRTVVEAAQVHAVLGRWDEAEALFERAATLFPRSPEAYRLFAIRLLEADRPARALRVALRALGRPEGESGPLWALVAEAWSAEGRRDEAERARRAAGRSRVAVSRASRLAVVPAELVRPEMGPSDRLPPRSGPRSRTGARGRGAPGAPSGALSRARARPSRDGEIRASLRTRGRRSSGVGPPSTGPSRAASRPGSGLPAEPVAPALEGLL